MLLLTSFTVENFRGIRQGTVSGLTDVNVLIGRNNSGKTTLLEAMQIGLTKEKDLDVLERTITSYWRVTRNAGVESEYLDQLHGVRVSYGFSARSRVGDLESLVQAKSGVVHLRGERFLVDVDLASAMGDHGVSNRVGGRVTTFASKASCYRPPDATNTAIEAKLWPQLLGDRSDKRLAAALNEVFGLQAESFQLLPSGKLIVLFENHSVPLDAQGDGTRAAMRCLMLLTALKQTLFIMEEPECHQHPGSLEKFALAVCKLAKQNEVQLMISTHSGECVKAFLKGAEAAKSDGAVFHLSLTDGIQTARRLDAEAVDTLQNTGIDVRFLDLYS